MIEGNYSVHFPERFSRATAIIVLRGGRAGNFLRYLRRTLFQTERAGQLEGGLDSIKDDDPMGAGFLQKSENAIWRPSGATRLPVADLPSMRDVNAAYSAWGLRR